MIPYILIFLLFSTLYDNAMSLTDLSSDILTSMITDLNNQQMLHNEFVLNDDNLWRLKIISHLSCTNKKIHEIAEKLLKKEPFFITRMLIMLHAQKKVPIFFMHCTRTKSQYILKTDLYYSPVEKNYYVSFSAIFKEGLSQHFFKKWKSLRSFTNFLKAYSERIISNKTEDIVKILIPSFTIVDNLGINRRKCNDLKKISYFCSFTPDHPLTYGLFLTFLQLKSITSFDA